jgi:hypothetical protein
MPVASEKSVQTRPVSLSTRKSFVWMNAAALRNRSGSFRLIHIIFAAEYDALRRCPVIAYTRAAGTRSAMRAVSAVARWSAQMMESRSGAPARSTGSAAIMVPENATTATWVGVAPAISSSSRVDLQNALQ